MTSPARSSQACSAATEASTATTPPAGWSRDLETQQLPSASPPIQRAHLFERKAGPERQSMPELADGDAQRTTHLKHQAEIEQAPRRQDASARHCNDGARPNHGRHPAHVRDDELVAIDGARDSG